MKTISREEFEKQNIFGTGAENTGFAQQERMVSGRRKRGMRKMIFHFSYASFGITDYL